VQKTVAADVRCKKCREMAPVLVTTVRPGLFQSKCTNCGELRCATQVEEKAVPLQPALFDDKTLASLSPA